MRTLLVIAWVNMLVGCVENNIAPKGASLDAGNAPGTSFPPTLVDQSPPPPQPLPDQGGN